MNAKARVERWVVLLAGGIGSRFWPASTPSRPKQFLPLASAQPLIADTVERAEAVAPASNVLIVAGQHLHEHLRRHLPKLEPERFLLEPQPRGTAAALAWAAKEIIARARAPERTVMVSLHSDHVVEPLDAFLATMERAIEAAARLDRLVTVGVPPSRPETGYGYIEAGDAMSPGVIEIRRFVEKPDRATAEDYLARGGFLWNSGMFVWRPQVLLEELTAHTPEIAREFGRLEGGDVTGFYRAVPTLSIDHGLMERSLNIAAVEAEFEWDDVGAWPALMRVKERDREGNLIVGEAHAVECGHSLLWAEDGPVIAFGLSEVVVVRASGITFVAPLSRTGDLKELLSELPERLRDGLD